MISGALGRSRRARFAFRPPSQGAFVVRYISVGGFIPLPFLDPVFSSPLFFCRWHRRFIRPLLRPHLRSSSPAERVVTRALVERPRPPKPGAPASLFVWATSFFSLSARPPPSQPSTTRVCGRRVLPTRALSRKRIPVAPCVYTAPLFTLFPWVWALYAPWFDASCVFVFHVP
jgi:hypothetical protein